MIRHYTSRAGDPHRHLHLQVNARVLAAGAWRGLHSVGVRDSIDAINGIGHAAVATDPQFRAVLAAHGFTLDPRPARSRELGAVRRARSAPGPRRSAATSTGTRPSGAREHPGEEPGPRLRRGVGPAGLGRGAPGQGRPHRRRGAGRAVERRAARARLPRPGTRRSAARRRRRSGWIDRDAAADLVVSRLGAKRSAWNAADIRGEVERLLAQTGLVADAAVRIELAEDLTARAAARRASGCSTAADVPEHIRALTSRDVLDGRGRPRSPGSPDAPSSRAGRDPARRRAGWSRVDPTQAAVVGALAGDRPAGRGRGRGRRREDHRAAADAGRCSPQQGHRMMVVTPTLKAAEVAAAETGADGVLRRLAGPPARLALGRRRPLDPRPDPTPTRRRPAAAAVTCCWSTRPGCSTRTPPAPC